eukprot:jgi/Psemu1/219984/e_gw1.1008.6.1
MIPTSPGSDKIYEVGGLTFSVSTKVPKVNKTTKIGTLVYKKEFRPPVGSKEETELIKAIKTKRVKPFKEINTSLKDPDS